MSMRDTVPLTELHQENLSRQNSEKVCPSPDDIDKSMNMLIDLVERALDLADALELAWVGIDLSMAHARLKAISDLEQS